MLARRVPGGPVPVLVPLSSWDPTEQALHSWLAKRLVVDYPGLSASAGAERGSRARALLEAGLILLVLDGLDEIADAVRGPAIVRINGALRPGQRLVLTSRTMSYRHATRPAEGIEAQLTGAAAIEICPLEVSAALNYLRSSAGGPASAARWESVQAAVLAPQPRPVAEVITTSLMVTMARVIYNPRPGETARDRPDPAELVDSARYPSRSALERHLFDAFIPAAYRPHPGRERRNRWSARRAERWLTFLARHLENRLHTTDLRWWEIPRALPHWFLPLIVGLPSFLIAFFYYVGDTSLETAAWIVLWPPFILAATVVATSRRRAPARRIGWSWKRMAVGLPPGLGIAVLLDWLLPLAVLPFAALLMLVFGLGGAPADLTAAAGPSTLLKRDRSTFGSLVLTFMTIGGALGLIGGVLTGDGAAALVGFFLSAIPVGLLCGLFGTVWPTFGIVRFWLALSAKLPWRLMRFLADAHQRGVLRQFGGSYQFRHLELQRRLALRR
jgi:hypothetical protein